MAARSDRADRSGLRYAMVRRRLPIGIQTFRELRERDCYYVDKTAYIKRLLDAGKHYFLSRPRRFGKSLFLDTLKEFFEGNQELFAGLYIHDRHDWTGRHPVVRLSFGGGNFKEPGYLDTNVMAQLDGIEVAAGVSPRYATAPNLGGLDRERVREWYNGYSWRGTEKVYNPYDLLLLFDSREFAAHWFETGTPAFLVDMLFERRVSSVSLDEMVSTAKLLSAFDVGRIGTEALLFQTGYLTITGEETLGGMALYRLGYPNREVRQSLNESLLSHLVQDPAQQTANSMRLARLLEAVDYEGLRELFHAFFASTPYQRYAAGRCRRTNNDIANYEGFYASVFYSYFAALGYEIVVEESSSHGRLDMAVRAGGQVYLFEFKVVELAPAGSALAQLRERDYAAKYRGGGGPIPMGGSRPSSEAAGFGEGQPIHLIGVEFSRDTRNVTAFEVAAG